MTLSVAVAGDPVVGALPFTLKQEPGARAPRPRRRCARRGPHRRSIDEDPGERASHAVWMAAAFASPSSAIAASRSLNLWTLPDAVGS